MHTSFVLFTNKYSRSSVNIYHTAAEQRKQILSKVLKNCLQYAKYEHVDLITNYEPKLMLAQHLKRLNDGKICTQINYNQFFKIIQKAWNLNKLPTPASFVCFVNFLSS